MLIFCIDAARRMSFPGVSGYAVVITTTAGTTYAHVSRVYLIEASNIASLSEILISRIFVHTVHTLWVRTRKIFPSCWIEL